MSVRFSFYYHFEEMLVQKLKDSQIIYREMYGSGLSFIQLQLDPS